MVFSGRLATDADIDGGLRVRALFFANSLEIRNELLYAMGAGWESYTIGNALEDVRVPLAVVIETGSMLPSTLLALAVVVEDPSGASVLSESFDLSVAERMRPIMRQCLVKSLRLRVTRLGVWRFILRSGDFQLAETTLEFKGRE